MVAVECSDKLVYLWFYIAQLSLAWFIVQSGSTKNSVLPTTGNMRYDFHSMLHLLSATKIQISRILYFPPMISCLRMCFHVFTVVLIRSRRRATAARARCPAWSPASRTGTSRSTSCGSRGTAPRRTPRRRRSCTSGSWPSTKWKFTLTSLRWVPWSGLVLCHQHFLWLLAKTLFLSFIPIVASSYRSNTPWNIQIATLAVLCINNMFMCLPRVFLSKTFYCFLRRLFFLLWESWRH